MPNGGHWLGPVVTLVGLIPRLIRLIRELIDRLKDLSRFWNAIENLEATLAELKGGVAKVRSEVKDLKKDVAETKGGITDLRGEIASLNRWMKYQSALLIALLVAVLSLLAVFVLRDSPSARTVTPPGAVAPADNPAPVPSAHNSESGALPAG